MSYAYPWKVCVMLGVPDPDERLTLWLLHAAHELSGRVTTSAPGGWSTFAFVSEVKAKAFITEASNHLGAEGVRFVVGKAGGAAA